jgi:hypothetical protein
VAFYGNSFARQLAERLGEIDPGIGVRIVFGPVAPPSHSYASFIADRGHQQADRVVLGVVSNTIPGLLSMTRATQSLVEPAPYTYPRYDLVGGELQATVPVITTSERLREALGDPDLWQTHADQLAQHDEFHSSFVFDASVFDHSIVARLLRRAWSARINRDVTASVRGPDGFDPDAEPVRVLVELVHAFGRQAALQGQRPLVLVVSLPGEGEDLDRLLRAPLREAGLDALHSADLCPPSNLEHFADDGHFSPACAEALATALQTWADQGP